MIANLIRTWQEGWLAKVFTYHAPTDIQVTRYSAIRAAAKTYAQLVVNMTPESVEQAQAMIKIQESVMWANAAIAINESE